MLFYKFRKKIRKFIRYLTILNKTKRIPSKEKLVYMDISEIEINRYLYSFIKMLDLSGYTVFLPKLSKITDVLSNTKGEFKYTSWLISDRIVKFGKPPLEKINININASQLSNNYFKKDFPKNSFHVPMCCYPWFYKNYYLLEKKNEDKPRKNSIFMAGNIDPAYYDRITNSKIFEQPSRLRISEYLLKQNYNLKIYSMSDLEEFLVSSIDRKLILIDTKKEFRIDLNMLPSVLRDFNFYLALPGIEIPQSHNLIEAMACSCIPIIHFEYAGLMKPKLTHNKNAFLFKNLEELDELIQSVFIIDEEKIEQMRSEVFEYYNTYLNPHTVGRKIENSDFEKIYIQAEHFSLKLLEN